MTVLWWEGESSITDTGLRTACISCQTKRGANIPWESVDLDVFLASPVKRRVLEGWVRRGSTAHCLATRRDCKLTYILHLGRHSATTKVKGRVKGTFLGEAVVDNGTVLKWSYARHL